MIVEGWQAEEGEEKTSDKKIKSAVAKHKHFLQGPVKNKETIVESLMAFIVGTNTNYQVHRLTQTVLRDGLQIRSCKFMFKWGTVCAGCHALSLLDQDCVHPQCRLPGKFL